jgi:hypothetical protein
MEQWNIGWFEKITMCMVFYNVDPSFHYSNIPLAEIAVWNSEGR